MSEAPARAETHYRSRRRSERGSKSESNNWQWRAVSRGCRQGVLQGQSVLLQLELELEHILNFKLSAGKLRHI